MGEIEAALSCVFPTKVARKVCTHIMVARGFALASLVSARGDVITPFFPPACKSQSSDPFVVDNCLSSA